MNYILPQQETIFIITNSLNQYSNIEAQTSEEFQQLESFENRNVDFDDMLVSNQESIMVLFFTRGCHNIIGIYYIS